MAEIKNNVVTQGLSGAIGRQLIFKRYGNRTIVSKMPDMSKVVKSKKQKEQTGKFYEATLYAKVQMLDPVAREEYKAKAKGMQRAHNVAISDFLNPPQIRNVNVDDLAVNKIIRIYAWDDFRVERVSVTIYQDDVLVEAGDAIEKLEWAWEYKVSNVISRQVKIEVNVWDKPGNKATKEIFI
ncbi:MAG TPA: hypothetical protein VHO90_04790 [Bacteroidales bacterium]|nr:hypothetical protein [Bacteroidales bacterium]